MMQFQRRDLLWPSIWPLPLLLATVLPGCLQAGASDNPTYSHRLRSEDAGIPLPDERLEVRLRGADSLGEGTLEAKPAFVSGNPVHYWDLGEANPAPQAAWVFRRRNDDGPPVDFGHPNLVDNVPGDEGYSPLCHVQIVYVTERYQDQRITSYAALEDALELGLIEEPEDSPQIVQWPITRTGGQLLLPDGTALTPHTFYYRDHQVTAFMLEDELPALTGVELSRRSVTPDRVFGLRPQNRSAWLEDQLVFSKKPGESGYTGLWTLTTTTVASNFQPNTIKDPMALFVNDAAGMPIATPNVLAFEPGSTVLFWPLIPNN